MSDIIVSPQGSFLTVELLISSLTESIRLGIIRPSDPIYLLDYNNRVDGEPTFTHQISLSHTEGALTFLVNPEPTL